MYIHCMYMYLHELSPDWLYVLVEEVRLEVIHT